MNGIPLHEKVYQFLEDYRKIHPDFYFAFRQRDKFEKGTKKSTRFGEGIWFQGNEGYAFVGLYDRSGGANKTRSFGLVFIKEEDRVQGFLEIVYKGEQDQQVIDFYHQAMDLLGGFKEAGDSKYQKYFSDDHFLSSVKNFLETEKPKIDQLVQTLGLNHLFIKKDKFNKNYNRIKLLRKTNQPLLNEQIEAYKKLLKGEIDDVKYDEIYKWEAIQHFQNNWTDNHTEDNIVAILKQSFDRENNNLWSGSHFLPYKMIVDFATKNPAVVSNMFQQLFDEQKDVYERIAVFQSTADELLETLYPDQDWAHYQTMRAIMLYLALRFPKKYYLYKNGMFNDFCLITKFREKPGSGKKYNYDILKHYTKMCDDVRAILMADEELLTIHKQILPDAIRFEDDYHVLTQDFIYCTTTYLKKKESVVTIKPPINMPTKKHPLNQILFGPPGTGKTYQSVTKALEICGVEIPDDRSEAKKMFDEKVSEGQIVFTTFHQSMSYEDFVEGIKPEVPKKEGDPVIYTVKNGIFKQIARRAKGSGSRKKTLKNAFDGKRFYKMSIGGKNEPEMHNWCIENSVLGLGWGGESDFTDLKQIADWTLFKEEYKKRFPDLLKESRYEMQAIFAFQRMKIGDIVIITRGNQEIDAIGILKSDYYYSDQKHEVWYQFRDVDWIATDMKELPSKFFNKNISQQTIYEFNKKDIKDRAFVNYFKSSETPVLPHVLIIDEINRGNVSQIFGELITLLETDKRVGNQEALEVTLPYSQDPFSVPSNLYIVGTMNTADRSVEALDTALRRRFSFTEMLPDPSLLNTTEMLARIWEKYANVEWEDATWIEAEQEFMKLYGGTKKVPEKDYQKLEELNDDQWNDRINSGELIEFSGIDLEQLLISINKRIRKLLDKDHQIGHSYFMNIFAEADLLDVMYLKIIPLLQEYFFGDYGKIGLVLGGGFVKQVGENDSAYFAPFSHHDDTGILSERIVFEIVDYRRHKKYVLGDRAFTFYSAIEHLMQSV